MFSGVFESNWIKGLFNYERTLKNQLHYEDLETITVTSSVVSLHTKQQTYNGNSRVARDKCELVSLENICWDNWRQTDPNWAAN